MAMSEPKMSTEQSRKDGRSRSMGDGQVLHWQLSGPIQRLARRRNPGWDRLSFTRRACDRRHSGNRRAILVRSWQLALQVDVH